MAEKISVVYPFSEHTLLADRQNDIYKELGIPSDTFIVGGSGTVDWRKGCDVFIAIANYFFNTYSIKDVKDVIFVWIGKISDTNKKNIAYDLEKLDLNEKVRFIGERKNPLDYYRFFDVFMLTSREDPFPLVCLESASLAKPILCFGNSGGMPEFVETDAGFTVAYLDIKQMAEKIFLLYKNPELKCRLGKSAKKKVLTRFQKGHSVDAIIKIINQIATD
jgi:glycosyltransferase involved in cell wall biosynthesis